MSDEARTPEGEAEELARRSKRLEGEIKDTRQEWERKRSDPGVPGAAPPEPDPADPDDAEEAHSPAAEAPPENANPGAAEARPEGAGGGDERS